MSGSFRGLSRSLLAPGRPVVDHPHIRALLEMLAESAAPENKPKP